MKTSRTLLLASLLGASAAHAQVLLTSGALNALIPDGDGSGYVGSLTTAAGGTVASITVSLNLSVPSGQAGWLGDLYAYVQHDSDLAVLVNRVGRVTTNPSGYDDSQSVGVTFADNAANGDIHDYRLKLSGNADTALTGTLSGIWAPDGRTADPAVVVAGDTRTASLGGFTDKAIAGSWNIFIADLSGGNPHRLDSWSISITAVPEPREWVAVPALALAGFAACWRRRARKLVT